MSSSIPNTDRLVVRWTIGDVRRRGFELLRISIYSAVRLFGPGARYVVCVNSIPLQEACDRTGPVPRFVEWCQITSDDLYPPIRAYFDSTLIEGMGWKLIPMRLYPERYELAIDNDCILWEVPDAMYRWLSLEDAFLMAEDVDRYLGAFEKLCPPGAFNCGIRGLPPGRDLRHPLEEVLKQAALTRGGHLSLRDEIEEQGLQAAAMCRMRPLLMVKTTEVTICSPFWPRSPELGSCGAHFVGLNAHHVPWDYFNRPADNWLEDHWLRHRPVLYQFAGLDTIPEISTASQREPAAKVSTKA